MAQLHTGSHKQPSSVTEVPDTLAGAQPDSMMESILQEIAAVGRRLEGRDTRISELTSESCSHRTDIAGFQDRVMGLDQRLTLVEDKLNHLSITVKELQFLKDKLTDLEDRSYRDNVHFFGILEPVEGTDVRAFLQDIIPSIMGLSFSPPLEFQRVYRIGTLRKDALGKPRLLIACFLWHEQVRQLLNAVQTHGPYTYKGHEVRLSPDFSRNTNKKQKAFLAV
ncbi:hypothetical protein NDU88_001786 [Pleurodeles waltl]|uniref:Uncharacterized protein n=1 Tax=Pleurodeles waltl TaxID=8319 RepID=A0AAV7KSD6_PLEWA|nr:hypothetical protein NDU88_001786 [Pleurodeles waltl]